MVFTSKLEHCGEPGVKNSFSSSLRMLAHICLCVCVGERPTGPPSGVDALTNDALGRLTDSQPVHSCTCSVATHTPTRTRAELSSVSDAWWSQGKTPTAHPVSSGKVSISSLESAERKWLRQQITSCPCPSPRLTAKTRLVRTVSIIP